jgi:nicotinate-nucleotide adenylyltransferase
VKKVGIYAGTFDPVHEGHLTFAREALELCGLDKVFFLVEPRPRRKQGVRAAEHRVAMVQLAIAEQRQFGSIVLEQSNFSVVETLPKLQALFQGAELYMLMGDDVLRHLSDWPHVDVLLQAVRFIVGVREGDETKVTARLQTLQQVRGLGIKYRMFVPSRYAYSSSKIRLRLKHGQEPLGVPADVLTYIKRNGLYTPDLRSA